MPVKIEKILKSLNIFFAHKNFKPMAFLFAQKFGRNPFYLLISCLLSLRSKDSVTIPVSLELFSKAKAPQDLLKIPIKELEKILYPLGFYRKKSEQLHFVCRSLINNFGGEVPSKKEELLSIKGVGPKTANLTLSLAFDVPAICVDTHVHRISNRIGFCDTKIPEQTEKELEKIVPQKEWKNINWLLVSLGQTICSPISPKCSECPIYSLCKKNGVRTSR